MQKMLICLQILFITTATSAFAQLDVTSLDPPQNALSVLKNTNLMATFNFPVDESTVVDSNIVVFAERTGTHFGALRYDATSQTLRFDPDKDFLAGERVTVTLTNKMRGAAGESFRGFTWHFTVKTTAVENFDFVFRGEWAAGQASYFDATDLNNDGYPDLVAADWFSDRVFLYLNDQKGNFYFLKTIMQDQGNIFSMVQFRDFDRDGLTDILVDSKHIFLMNQANNDFKLVKPEIFNELLAGYSLLADYDNDGHSDLVLSLFKRDSLWVYKGLGETDFQFQYYQPLPETGNPSNPTEGTFDINNDGQIDLIAQLFAYSRDSLIVFFNNGNLTFKTDSIYDPIKRIISGDQYTNDLDNDGDMDHAVFGSPKSDESYYLMINDGSDQFDFRGASLFQPKTSVFGGDIDADGDIDLVSGWGKVLQVMPWISEGYISLLRNEGNQKFTITDEIQFGEGIGKVVFLDIDRDDDLDIVGLNFTTLGRNIFWMENTIGTAVRDEASNSPGEFVLEQNYPNPFNASTMISYSIPYQTMVILKVYDTNGKEVRTLVERNQNAGVYRIQWKGINNFGREVSSGIYVIQMQAGRFNTAKRTLLLK